MLDSADLQLSAVALGDFKSKNKQWQCFNAFMHEEGDNWVIAFVAKDVVRIEGDVALVNASKCGEGLTYHLNDKGKIIRRTYHR